MNLLLKKIKYKVLFFILYNPILSENSSALNEELDVIDKVQDNICLDQNEIEDRNDQKDENVQKQFNEKDVIEDKIVSFLINNIELRFLIEAKLAGINSGLKELFNILFSEDLCKIEYSSKDKNPKLTGAFKISQVIKIFQIGFVQNSEIIKIFHEDKDSEINDALSKKILNSLKFEYLTKYIQIVEGVLEGSNLTKDQKNKIFNEIKYNDSKFDRESLSLSGISEIFLTKIELDQMLFNSEKKLNKSKMLTKEILDIFDMRIEANASIKNFAKKDIEKNLNYSGSINIGKLLNYLFINNEFLKKELNKNYQDLKKNNELAVLFLNLQSISEKISKIDSEKETCSSFKNYDDILKYLRLEKEYMEEMNKYSEKVLEVKKIKKELGYYIYRMVMENGK